MSETLKKIEEFEKQCLVDLLNQCKPEQIDMFNRMYKSIDQIKRKQIPWAIQQCESTIAKNKKRAEDESKSK